jgi:hypothetical protein
MKEKKKKKKFYRVDKRYELLVARAKYLRTLAHVLHGVLSSMAFFAASGDVVSRQQTVGVAPQILIVLFLIYLFDNIIQLISLRNLWYYGGW